MGGLTVLLRPMNLIATVVLARLLDPADFGLVALAMILFSTSYLFVGMGMGAAIVHSSHETKEIAFPAFLVTLISGLLFYCLVIWNVEPIANFLGTPNVVPVLNWLSLIILLNACSIVPQALLRRDLLFVHAGTGMVMQQLVYLICAVGLAWMGYGYWSLVFGQLLGQLAFTLWICWFCPGWDWLIPKRLDLTILRELVDYGLKTFSGGITSYVHSHWDDWLVGRMLGEVALGFYSKAYQFSNDTVGKLAKNTIGTVFFSTYVKIRDDQIRLRNTYVKSTRMVLVVMTPIAFGLAVLAPQLVSIVFGSKWTPMTLTLQIFALVILSRPISENSSPFFQALGHPEYNLRAGISLLVVMVPLALVLLPWGQEGIALAVTVSHFWGAAYNIYQSETLVKGVARPILQACGLSYVSGAAMALAVYIMNQMYIVPANLDYTIIGLLISVGFGAIIYFIALYVFQKNLFFEIIKLVGEQLQRFHRFMPARLFSGSA